MKTQVQGQTHLWFFRGVSIDVYLGFSIIDLLVFFCWCVGRIWCDVSSLDGVGVDVLVSQCSALYSRSLPWNVAIVIHLNKFHAIYKFRSIYNTMHKKLLLCHCLLMEKIVIFTLLYSVTEYQPRMTKPDGIYYEYAQRYILCSTSEGFSRLGCSCTLACMFHAQRDSSCNSFYIII